MASIRSSLDQTWGIKLGADLVQSYADAPVVQLPLLQPYGDASMLVAPLEQRWRDMVVLAVATEQPWAITATAQAILAQPWAITDGAVLSWCNAQNPPAPDYQLTGLCFFYPPLCIGCGTCENVGIFDYVAWANRAAQGNMRPSPTIGMSPRLDGQSLPEPPSMSGGVRHDRSVRS